MTNLPGNIADDMSDVVRARHSSGDLQRNSGTRVKKKGTMNQRAKFICDYTDCEKEYTTKYRLTSQSNWLTLYICVGF